MNSALTTRDLRCIPIKIPNSWHSELYRNFLVDFDNLKGNEFHLTTQVHWCFFYYAVSLISGAIQPQHFAISKDVSDKFDRNVSSNLEKKLKACKPLHIVYQKWRIGLELWSSVMDWQLELLLWCDTWCCGLFFYFVFIKFGFDSLNICKQLSNWI